MVCIQEIRYCLPFMKNNSHYSNLWLRRCTRFYKRQKGEVFRDSANSANSHPFCRKWSKYSIFKYGNDVHMYDAIAVRISLRFFQERNQEPRDHITMHWSRISCMYNKLWEAFHGFCKLPVRTTCRAIVCKDSELMSSVCALLAVWIQNAQDVYAR